MDGCGDGSMMVQIKFSHTWSVMMLMVAKPQITFTRAVERTDTHTCDAARDQEMWVFEFSGSPVHTHALCIIVKGKVKAKLLP